MWHCRETGAAWRAILLDRRPHCARVAVMPARRRRKPQPSFRVNHHVIGL